MKEGDKRKSPADEITSPPWHQASPGSQIFFKEEMPKSGLLSLQDVVWRVVHAADVADEAWNDGVALGSGEPLRVEPVLVPPLVAHPHLREEEAQRLGLGFMI